MDKSLRNTLNQQAALQEQEELQVAERQIDEEIEQVQNDPRRVALLKSLRGWLQSAFTDISTASSPGAPGRYSGIFAAVARAKAVALDIIHQIKPKAPAQPDARLSHYWFDRVHHRNPAVENQTGGALAFDEPLPSYDELDEEIADGTNLIPVQVLA